MRVYKSGEKGHFTPGDRMESENNKTSDGYDQSSNGVPLKKDPRICDSAKVPAAFSEENEINDIIKGNEYLKENITLLKIYLRWLGDLILLAQKKKRNNFNEMYAAMQIERDKAKVQQKELEKLRKSKQELLEKQKSEFELKKTEWEQKLMDHENLYNIVKQCCELLSDISNNNKLGIAQQTQQKNRCKKLQFKVNRVKITAEQNKEKLIRQEQMFKEKLDGIKDAHEMALQQRDRTISILTKQLKLLIEESTKAQRS
uniref:Bm8627 n=1 Tax=Brugia malayi TaxID=6279 RepID=A0A0H5S202_BRUMA|nr:Bm8627 [Brugia malayi]